MGIILQETIAQCHIPVFKVSKVAESDELLIGLEYCMYTCASYNKLIDH